jgi:tetratricopeptide (TPR) repeat protein
MQALFRELQGARKRTESALTMLTGKNDELNNTRFEIDATLKEALTRMTQAVALLPMGETQFRAQDYIGALETYRRAAEMDDGNPLIHYRAGYTAAQVNQLERAMQHLNRALDIDPEFAPGLAALGYVYRRMAEVQETDDKARNHLLGEAERYLQEALRQQRRLLDEDGEAWMATLAGVYRRRRQFDQAIRFYTDATDITPFASYPYASIALVYADKGDYTQMVKNYERVEWRARNEISSRPTNPWGHANLLLARLALGRDEKLIEEEFTLIFLSMPKEAAFIVSTLVSSLRRLEWALASAGHAGRAERAALLLRRIERLEPGAIHTTQVMRHAAPRLGNQNDIRRTTGIARAVNNGGGEPSSTSSLASELDFNFD